MTHHAAPSDAIRFHPSAPRTGALPPVHVERLYQLLGEEQSLDEVARALRHYVQGEKPGCVGALLLTCADEGERECRDAFERNFVRYLLPQMKLSSRSEFHMANLGARYEWGAARVAEDHYADAQPTGTWKLMLLKINAHVAIDDSPSGPVFGRGQRYDNPRSTYCGALAATLAGDERPFAQDLSVGLRSAGIDRLEALRDAGKVQPEHAPLFAAAASARAQARRAMLDIQDHDPATPTLWVIVPGVTLNRAGHDTEVPLGVYAADRRTDEPHDEWCGIGDRPELYRLVTSSGRVSLRDDEMDAPRHARDHRALIAREWDQAGLAFPIDPAVRHAVRDAHAQKQGPEVNKALKAAVEVALALSPVPAAAILFGQGLVGIHHASRARKLTQEARADDTAREMLRDVTGKIEALPPEQARHVIQLLHDEYGE